MPATTLIVKVIADTTSAANKLQATAASTSKFASGMRKAAIPVAAIGLAAAGAAGMVVDAASQQQQAMGAVDAVFGHSADTVKSWASSAADSVGLATSEYAQMASVIGSQLGNLGLPQDQVLGKTKDLISMGADLAAMYGGTTSDAVQALSATLRGEYDPIERYGISVKQSDVNARLLAEGHGKLTGKAAKAAKVTATLALLTGQGAKASGQFARESGTLANQQQKAAAKFQNTKAAIGTALLPVMTTLAGMLGKVAEWAGKHPKLMAAIIVSVVALAAAFTLLNVALAIMDALASPILVPLLLIVAAIAAVVVIIVLLWKKSAAFRSAVLASWKAIKAAAVAVWGAIVNIFQTVLIPLFQQAGKVIAKIGAAVVAAWLTVLPALMKVWPVIQTIFAVLVVVFRAVFTAVVWVVQGIIGTWQLLVPIIGIVARIIKVGIDFMITTFKMLWAVGKAVVSAIIAIWQALSAAVSAVGAAIGAVFNALVVAALAVWSAIRAVGRGIVAVWQAVRNGIAAAITFVKNVVFTALRTAVGLLARAFVAAKNVMIGAFNLLKAGIAVVLGRIRALFTQNPAVDKLVSAFRAAKDTILGIWTGIKDGINNAIQSIKGWINDLLGSIGNVVGKIPGLKHLVGLSAQAAAVPPAPMPRIPTPRSSSVSSRSQPSAADALAGATFQLILDGQVVERAVTKVTVAQNRALARRIVNGRPAV